MRTTSLTNLAAAFAAATAALLTGLAVGAGAAAAAAAAAATATSPDSAGLVGSSPDKATLPLKLWAHSPKMALKPRRRDLHEANLLHQMGDDFDPRWMRTRAHFGPDPSEAPRQSLSKLAALAAREALPDELPAEARQLVREWLVRRSTCSVRYEWSDLGFGFWPRWVRRGHCSDDPPAATTTTAASAAAKNATSGGGAGGSGGGGGGGGGEGRSCSWPPGMHCQPSAAKVLQLLRWHCRMRKSALSNSVWPQAAERKKKKRKHFRCLWLKVPYPVLEDCTCGVPPPQ